MKTLKKALALLLAALLAFSCMAVGVTAGEEEEKPPVWKKGDIITLGSYEQDNNTENGKEPIEWILLDPENGMCISKYILDVMHFCEAPDSGYTVREWLYEEENEGVFYKNSFTDKEKNVIQTWRPDDYSGKVFLLSINDEELYFNRPAEKPALLTAYANREGNFNSRNGAGSWWLCTGYGYIDQFCITTDGSSTHVAKDRTFCGVRPVIYADLNDGYFDSAVTLDANDGTGRTAIRRVKKSNPIDVACPFTNGELEFCGWYMDADCTEPVTYADRVSDDTTLYAGWTVLKRGDIIELGSYPRSRVEDEVVIADLDSLAEESEWISYDYYSGTDEPASGQMAPSDFMRYTDVTLEDGSRYRGVYFDNYRPDKSYEDFPSGERTPQYENGYYREETWWFRYEPITWRVLDPKTGLVLSEDIIDTRSFNDYVLISKGYSGYWADTAKALSNQFYGNEECTYFASDYYNSSIRGWLINDFTDLAFGEDEQAAMQEYYCDSRPTHSGTYDCRGSADKVFLLSFNEIQDPDLGFPVSGGPTSSRAAVGTDYAKCQNLKTMKADGEENQVFDGGSWWWLRSHCDSSFDVYAISFTDESSFGFEAYTCFNGVRPALKLDLKSGLFSSEITLDANGGTGTPVTRTVASFRPFCPECTFTNEGYSFCGWYKDAECTQPWTVTDTVRGDMTLYAGWTTYKKGDVIKFGLFEQDNHTGNLREPIEWVLLDPETGLCISKYGLEKMEFDDDSNNYAESEIRMWLYGQDGEGEFYTNAFNMEEKAAIKTGNVVTYRFDSDTNIISTLNDKVFMLSVQEADTYFAAGEARGCGSTAYAENGTDGNEGCGWWLRSPGYNAELSLAVFRDGSIMYDGCSVFDEGVCVRPALYLDLKSDEVRTGISGAKVEAIPDQAYTGSPIEPGVTVKDGDKVLTKDTDYTVSYSNNIGPGTGMAEIEGINKYRGKKNVFFTIIPAPQNAPAGVSKTDETKCSANDGKITGVTTAMEIAYERGEYKPCKGTEITGLQPGTYSVRFPADDNHTASDAVQLIIGKGACYGGEATCIAPAVCEACSETYGKINPDNHAYNKVSYTWSKSYDNCNATFTCQNNAEHTETVSCKVNKVLDPEPTCTEEGLWTCTATVTFEGKDYTDVKTYSAPAKDHNPVMKSDEDYHWMECECGYTEGKAAHKDEDKDLKCDTCGYNLAAVTEIKGFPTEAMVLRDKAVDFGCESSYGKVIYTSSDPSVATVDENGVVTPVGRGECTITAQVEGSNIREECSVTVTTSFLQFILTILGRIKAFFLGLWEKLTSLAA